MAMLAQASCRQGGIRCRWVKEGFLSHKFSSYDLAPKVGKPQFAKDFVRGKPIANP